ncbi:hypothetical protein [Anaeromyxobacter paludicola]|uniref:DUF1772 domain-containing protein n=1 Tax=Anaeromyxobacter paludicola TaxID=2918171 RepID=A0ABN6N5F9_9BACT|nr:hypothetical protein [Anaeromyxobacter paludicola]BDG08397.1 hypothetical protein AMPC_15100 [Anaeromyxobacter paludicola]
MSAGGWAVWGFVATALFTGLMAGSQGLGLTRMNVPFMLGTLFTPERSRAKVIGAAVHLANGWALALFYAAALRLWGGATWWRGALLGLGHAAFVLTVVMPLLPGVHPRMASEQHGPEAGRLLEPPGFLALHYGWQTPLWVVLGHLAYGLVLGHFLPGP